MNMFKMMKQAATMQKEMKQIQKSLAKKTATFSVEGGLIVATARGDMTLESIKIDPKVMENIKMDKLERVLVTAVNGAMSGAKDMAGSEMSKMAGDMGLGGMLGG
jgi:DNA-binding YbaB/EbfC family protein